MLYSLCWCVCAIYTVFLAFDRNESILNCILDVRHICKEVILILTDRNKHNICYNWLYVSNIGDIYIRLFSKTPEFLINRWDLAIRPWFNILIIWYFINFTLQKTNKQTNPIKWKFYSIIWKWPDKSKGPQLYLQHALEHDTAVNPNQTALIGDLVAPKLSMKMKFSDWCFKFQVWPTQHLTKKHLKNLQAALYCSEREFCWTKCEKNFINFSKWQFQAT